MQLSHLILIIVLSAVTYRVTRFIILDSLIDGWRKSFYEWALSPLSDFDRTLVLDQHIDDPLDELPAWRKKLYQLFSCPFCISVWVAAGAVALQHLFADDAPTPIWTWLAVATGGLIFYAIIDSE